MPVLYEPVSIQLCVSMCTGVCECMCEVCVLACACMCVRVLTHTHVDQRMISGVFFNYSRPYSSEMALSLKLGLIPVANQQTSGISLSLPRPCPVLQCSGSDKCCHAKLFTWVRGIKLGSSCLCNKTLPTEPSLQPHCCL